MRLLGLGCFHHQTPEDLRASLFMVEEFVGAMSLKALLRSGRQADRVFWAGVAGECCGRMFRAGWPGLVGRRWGPVLRAGYAVVAAGVSRVLRAAVAGRLCGRVLRAHALP